MVQNVFAMVIKFGDLNYDKHIQEEKNASSGGSSKN